MDRVPVPGCIRSTVFRVHYHPGRIRSTIFRAHCRPGCIRSTALGFLWHPVPACQPTFPSSIRLSKKREPAVIQFSIINIPVIIPKIHCLAFLFCQQPLLCQLFQINKIWIPCKG